MKELKIEYLKTEDIIPYANNPRHNDDAVDYVANSIQEFGFNVPIILDKNNVIVAGHTRLKAANQLGLKSVPCVRTDDLTDDQIKAFRIADNKVAELATWDIEKLNIELADIDLDMSDFGFDLEVEGLDAEEAVNTKDDSIEYFAKAEIQEDIVSCWKTYESIDEFVDNIIDLPTAKYQFNRLCQGYRDGYNISLLFNKHRLDTETIISKSIYYGFNHDQKYIKSFARYIVNITNKVVPKNQYYRFIGIGSGGYQFVNEFQPYLARDIYKRYVKDGDKILNPCAGWGGRLIGLASCMFNNIEYVETDPATKTFEGLQKLKAFLRLGDNYKQYNLPFEELEVEADYFDFVFTSPPYFDTEHYSDEDTQSFKRNDSYSAWRDNFLYVMIDKIMYCMKHGATCMLNVGNKKYHISDDIKRYLKDKYSISINKADYSLDANSEDAIRSAEEDFLTFVKE